MFVAPHFFIHRWETKSDKAELCIEIPLNIKDVVLKMRNLISKDVPNTDTPFAASLNSDLMQHRKSLFRKQLLTITYKACLLYLDSINDFEGM